MGFGADFGVLGLISAFPANFWALGRGARWALGARGRRRQGHRGAPFLGKFWGFDPVLTNSIGGFVRYFFRGYLGI